jgi:tRNA pseudouridine55 synthase
VKRLLPKGTKIGHTGTLDPLASGLLVLLVGRATRLSRYVTGLDKAYTATAVFGAVSDTLDADGRVTPLQNVPMPDKATLRAATQCFTGDLLQTPPMASAVKVKGERLYKAHRRGALVERESRHVKVYSFELLSLDAPAATFAMSCGSGTYVRALISDLADSLNTGAYLTALRRTRVGCLRVGNALPPEELTPATLQSHIIPPGDVLAHLPVVSVPVGAGRLLVCDGRPLAAFGVEGSYRVEAGGELLAVYRDEPEGGGARAEVVLCVG